MPLSKFIYIIDGDGQIFEFAYTLERLMAATSAMTNKGVFTVQGSGAILNGSYMKKVLDDGQYDNYLSTEKPREYVKNGVWYRKNGDIVRYEPWKQEIRSKMLKAPEVPEVTDEEKEKVGRRLRDQVERMRPNKGLK
jgi:hypothetical protein